MELIQIDGLIAITTQEPDTFKLEWLSNLFQSRNFWTAISIITLVALLKYYSSTRKSLLFLQPGDRDYIKKNNHQTLTISAISVLISFSVPLWLNLPISKESTGAQILQSLLTVSGGLVLLLTFMENRRKNDIDELKNLDESIQKLHTNRHERNTKSIELMFSSNTPAAVSAAYSLCNIADEWVNESKNSENEDKFNSHKEAQSIINVLCTYIREYGKEQENKPKERIYNELVCKTILEELSNRLNTLNKGYSHWNGYNINLKGATLIFPVELKNIKDTNSIDISECTFKDDLIITIAVDKNDDTDSNETEPRVLSLEGCIFNSSVSIVGNLGAEISKINLQNTHFKEKSRLEISRFSFENSASPSIYIHGTQPHETVFSYLSNAYIVVGMEYQERIAGNYEEKLDYQEIPGNIKISDCPDVSFKISDRHLVSGEVHVDCKHRYLKMFDVTDCIMNGKITIDAKKIGEIKLQESYVYHGLNVACKEEIQLIHGPDSVFLFDGLPNILQVEHSLISNTKSNVEITANSIISINLNGAYFYTPFKISNEDNTIKIKNLSFFKTVFYTLVNIDKNTEIEKGNFKFCSVYDKKTQKYYNFNPQKTPNIQELVPRQEITTRAKKIADTISAIALAFGLTSK
ncbi:hypothetical protein [uncultured Rothia sp.]|uniref:hypothetical protein n=1 Tax=uncultured Rothia sp. TaxID=316088 RepID=UPI0028DB838D|nr:hypothetical protein [uncultured Rothia sp.]